MMSFGQNVYIPDANFKAYLVGNSEINTNGDTEIQVSEAEVFEGIIYCDYASISDLTGIEAFTALNTLYCAGNQLTSLDVTHNTVLEKLLCYNNQLTSLDVSQNSALDFLGCEDNQLECLNVKNGNNTAFQLLHANGNTNLTCVEVDNVSYSMNNWNNVLFIFDVQTSFSTDCGNECADCTPSSSTDSHTACESYTWIDGNIYTSSNNIATYIIPNTNGCDSTITLDLTITPLSTSSLIETACSFYLAPDDEVYTSTGSYTATIDNAAGCDSVIYIDLTIHPLPSNEVTQNGTALIASQTSATYQWLDCDNSNTPIEGEVNQTYFPSTTGNYAVIVTVNGCRNTSECILVDFTGIVERNKTPKQLVKIVDVLGRKTPLIPNTPLLYIYDDGTVERKMIIE
jgi:hypothetical protein